VRINNTGEYPWRAIASLVITAKDNSMWIGTGWFISPRTLITAGHCVYIKGRHPGRDGWVKKISVMPGRNAASLPFGSVTSTVFRTVSGWIKTGGENFDYAAIILPTPLGDTVGVFGIGVFPDNELTGQKSTSRLPRRQAVGRAVVRRQGSRTRSTPTRCSTTSTPPAARAARPCSGRERQADRRGRARLRRQLDELGHADQRQGAPRA
jgi:hypothetical protein